LSTTIASLAAKVSKFKEFADKIRAEAGPSYATEYAEQRRRFTKRSVNWPSFWPKRPSSKRKSKWPGFLRGFRERRDEELFARQHNPELNKLIDRYIKVLDDIDIEVSTVATLKSRESREKFNIGVVNKYGASTMPELRG
jgi:hypothetical protein